jgi:hypothetical protein
LVVAISVISTVPVDAEKEYLPDPELHIPLNEMTFDKLVKSITIFFDSSAG